MTTSSPTTTRSRTHAWSPTITRAPRVVPANTIAPVETTVPAPTSAGGSGSRFAVERGESVGCFPTTAPSSTFTPSPRKVPSYTIALGWISATPRRRLERLRQAVQRADDAGPVLGDRSPVALAGDQVQECLALESQRLGRV